MAKSKTYSVGIECNNCDHKGKVFLPRGMKISEVLSKTDCPHCGCKTLEKKSSFIIEKIQPYTPLPNPPTNPTIPWQQPFYFDRVTCSDDSKRPRFESQCQVPMLVN